jgi:FAD/FMN-containing dehydrogenase
VHGQNHYREGSFRKNIIDLKIFHPKYGQITISPHDSTKIFDLTVGGFGLTGVIIQATLRVIPIHTNLLERHVRRFDTLFDGYQMLVSDSNGYDYFHSWANLSNLSKEGEKGFYYAAKYVADKEIVGNYLEPDWQHRKHLAIKPNLFGTRLLRGVNKIYYFTNARASTKVLVLSDLIFPSRSKLWYFSMFGNRGLIEHQVLIPHQSVEVYLKALRTILRKWNPLISLCHLKLFRGKQSLLNFDGEGLCLAIHLSNNPVSMDTLDEIDNLDVECGAIVNIIKDSRVSKDILCQQYPEYDKFVRRIDDYDKDRIFQNTISQKLFV